VLRLLGWRIEGDVPDVARCVIIVAPHTSNWDFVVGMATMFALDLRIHWLGKDALFRWPFRGLLQRLGGVPVDRTSPDGVVSQAIAHLRGSDAFFLGLSPEGTRHKVERWKSGFHRIAHGAGVPIFPVALDYRPRAVRLMGLFAPTADYEADLATLMALYSADMARNRQAY
jgi:1-acyl-sn-glycerol-3-phosphate acyltransferase